MTPEAPETGLPRSPAGNYNPWAIACMLSLAPFMEVLDTTIANVALNHIAGSLAASQSESTWVLTSYLVSNSIVLPISGWLANVLGRKRFYMICVALFTASSVLCAFSTSLEMIIVARVLQGLGGGGLQPATQSMLADSFVPEKRAQVFALFGVTIIVAPATGPLIGGWLTDNLSWHWIFLINLPVGLVALTMSAIFISEPPLLVRERAELLARGLKMDYFGLFLVAAGFGALQIFLDKFELDDGFSSPFITALFAIFTVALSTLAVWEWGHPQPVMNFRLFMARNFAVSCVVMFFLGFLFLSSTQLLPQLAQTLLGYNAQTAGFSLALGGMATLLVVPVAGIISGRFVQPRLMIIFALLEMGWALLQDSHFAPNMSFDDFSQARIAQVLFLPFIFIPVAAGSYVGVPPRNNGEASALLNQMRNIGGSIGISFVTTMLAWRTQFHHARLAESITPYGSQHGMALPQIAAIVQEQANFVSYLDVFRILGIVALVIWPIVLFFKMPARRAT
jgi:MFS transporter, DHA2 family, multidrug resistance protein